MDLKELARQVFSPEEIKVIEEAMASSLNKIIQERLILKTRLNGDFSNADVSCKSLTTNKILGEAIIVKADSFSVADNLVVTKNNVRINVMELNPSKEITLLAVDSKGNVKKIKVDYETLFG